MAKCLTSFILCFLVFTSWGQDHNIRFDNLGVEDGLAMGTITKIEKGEDGHMYIATAEGLHKYSGYDFKIYKHKLNGVNSISDSYVTALAVRGKNVWIGNHSGYVDRIEQGTDKITTYDLILSNGKRNEQIISSIYSGEDLLVGTVSNGLFKFKDGRFVRLDSFKNFSIRNIVELQDGRIWILSNRGFFEYENENIKYFEIEDLPWLAVDVVDNEDFIYIGTPNGLYAFNKSKKELKKLQMTKKRVVGVITDLEFDEKGYLWIGSKGGLHNYHDGHFHYYQNDPNKKSSLVADQVRCLFYSNEILWVGTISGLSKYSKRLNQFNLVDSFSYRGRSVNNNVYNIYEDRQKRIWVGTLTGGLSQFNRKAGKLDVIPEIVSGGIRTKAVRCIYQDKSGQFWIGTRDEGLFTFDPIKRSFKHVKGTNGSRLSNRTIRSIYEDSRGQFWIGTQNGLNMYDRELGKFIYYPADSNSLSNNSIYQIKEWNGKLVLGSFRGGLQFFDLDNKSYSILKHSKDDISSLSSSNVMCLEIINADSLLVGTYGGGLNIYDRKSGTFSFFSEDDGLANNVVYGIVYDSDGSCWLSTNNGLSNVNIYTNEITNYGLENNLQNLEFNEGAFVKSTDGTLFFGGIDGFNFFNPDAMVKSYSKPKLVISSILSEKKALDKDSESIRLPYTNSFLSFSLSVLDFHAPQNVEYYYKLNSYNSEFRLAKANKFSYQKLDPGNYKLEVYAKDKQGYWETDLMVYNVSIKPPYWKSFWFIFLSALLLFSTIFLIVRYRTRSLRESFNHQLVDLELRALRSQMNPHFIFNSLNSIQYYILQNEPKEAYNYLSKFSALMRKILQNSRLKQISIADEIEWLNLYLDMERMRMDNNLNYEIDSSAINDIDVTGIPTMLIQPYVENSIAHGLVPKESDDKKLSIKFLEYEEHIICEIEDNGIGRAASRAINAKKSSKHQSAGMKLTAQRLEVLAQGKGTSSVDIQDLMEDADSKGTKVILKIPKLEVEL